MLGPEIKDIGESARKTVQFIARCERVDGRQYEIVTRCYYPRTRSGSLVVHRSVAMASDMRSNRWSVSHRELGRTVTKAILPTREEALKMCLKLDDVTGDIWGFTTMRQFEADKPRAASLSRLVRSCEKVAI